MKRFGYNISFRQTPEEILEMGQKLLGSGQFQAIEVTHYENMEGVDTHPYNEAVRQLVAAYHPQVLVHISGFNLSEENSVLRSAMINEFRNCCKYTKELGGKEIIIHCGHAGHCLHVPLVKHSTGYAPSEYERCWSLSVDLMKTCCDIAKQYDMTLYTENLNERELIVRCNQLVKFVDEVNRDNLAIVFDIGHCHRTKGDIPSEVVECGKYLHHLHLHDNFGEKDDHLPVGEATTDWKSFCDALKKVDYQDVYMMEVLNHVSAETMLSSKENLLKYMEE